MPNGYRFAAFALGIALCASASAQEPAQPTLESKPEAAGQQRERATAGEADAAPKQQSTLDLPLAIQGVEAAIRDLISEEDKVAAQEEAQRNKDDLKAQQRMAVWAFWMFVATAVTVLLTGVGVVLIWRTLIHTRRAAEYAGDAVVEARNATKAAQDAVEVTRDIGARQTRAYVGVGKTKIENVAAGLVPKAEVHVKNFGQTPVKLTSSKVWFNLAWFPEHGQLPNPDLHTMPSVMVLSPGRETTLFPDLGRPLTSSEFNHLQAGTQVIFVYGALKVIDIFGTEDTVTFQLKYAGDVGMNDAGLLAWCDQGNDATYFEKK